jgi:dihydrofolate synthase/folylpolyglutamate synthase
VAVGGQVLALQGLAAAYGEVFLPLHGAHQAQNAAVALAAAELLLGADARPLDPDLVRQGFAGVTAPGRLERVRTAPTILLDAAHNPHGMAATVAALVDEFEFRKLVAVVAVVRDKDAAGMLELLEPVCAAVVATQNSSTRALPAARLGAVAAEIFGAERVRVVASIPDAVEAAVALAEEDLDPGLGGVGVVVTGSVFTVADARRLLVR